MKTKQILVAALVALMASTGFAMPLAAQNTAHAATIIPGLSNPALSITDPSVNKTYVAGDGNIAVIDNATNQVIKYIASPSIFAEHGVQLFLNPTAHRVYVVNVTTVIVIDTTTDTMVTTAGFNFAGVPTYDPTTDTIYGEIASAFGVTPATMTLEAINGSDLSVLRSVDSTFTQVSWAPSGGRLLVDSANQRLYVIAGDPATPTTVFKELDAQTFATIAESHCNTVDICTAANLTMYGGLLGYAVNPADGTVWFSMDITAPGTTSCSDNGGCGTFGGSAVMTRFWHYDPIAKTLSGFNVVGRAILQGFDPQTGLMYVAATDLPTVDTSGVGPFPPSTPNTGSEIVDLGTVDPNAATPVITRITIDGNDLAPIGGSAGSLSCNNGPLGFGLLGFDFGTRTIYWRCDGMNGSLSQVVVSKMNYTPDAPGTFPTTDFAQFVAEVPTQTLKTLNFAGFSPVGDADGRVALSSSFINGTILVDPTTLSTASVNFVAQSTIPDPVFVKVSGQVIDSSTGKGVQGATVTISSPTTTLSTATDILGDYYISGVPQTTDYTVTVDPGNLVAPNGTSQALRVNFVNVSGVNFQLADPLTMKVAWNVLPGWALNLKSGSSFTGAVTLNQAAPAGGIVVNLASDSSALKVPSTVTVPAGSLSTTFTATAGSVKAKSVANVTASYAGTYNPAGTSAAAAPVAVYPADNIKVTSATWSQSTGLLSVTATYNNVDLPLAIQDGKTNLSFGSMTTDGNGNYSMQFVSSTRISSVILTSIFGTAISQGVSKVN